ncbi:hypothetical protein BDV25DRAFT_135007 [Aspergillus avenaceus]|uniref:Uncharacterized protein n=1 Tax=Aspergillus avenaceus TaxID=36643 RepID=A0A5N6U9K1_ASPAV|nr:hypothetical protein BDV25DRAFT_135007 [Aspergillus avenaceus]
MGTWDSAYKKCYLSRNKDTDSIQSFRNFLVLEKIKQDKRPDPDTPGPGHVSVNELSNQGIANLCPSYGNKRFLTTDSGGTKHEWEILCSYVCDASTWLFNYQVPCPIGNAVDLVKQYHSRSDYTGFWFNQFGCNQQLPRPFGPSQATCFYNPAWWTHGWVHRTRTFSS